MLRITPSSGRDGAETPAAHAFIPLPPRINPLLRAVLWGLERPSGEPFVGGRLIAWHTPTAVSMLAAGTATWVFGGRVRRRLGTRLIDSVALAAAFTEGSPYCATDFAKEQATFSAPELEALRSGSDVAAVPTFTERERVAIRYARLISSTPLDFPPDFVAELTATFTEPEIVAIAAVAADINYNGRLFEALGAPPPLVSR